MRHLRAQHSGAPTPSVAPNPNGEPRTPGQRARARRRSIIYGRINYLAVPGREEAAETTPPEVAALPLGLGGRGASPRRGSCSRRLPRGGLREERGGTCRSRTGGSETSQLGRGGGVGAGGVRRTWLGGGGGVGRAWPVNSFLPYFIHSHLFCEPSAAMEPTERAGVGEG